MQFAIRSRAILVTVAASVLVSVGAGRADVLKHGDGAADGRKSLGGSGEMIEFETPKPAEIAAVRIHGSRYGTAQPPKEDFLIYFLNADMSRIVAAEMAPYSLFKRGESEWVEVKFNEPVSVPAEFWICLDFRAGRTKGVFVSYDSSSDGSHSRMGLPGMRARKPDFNGDWMIEAVTRP